MALVCYFSRFFFILILSCLFACSNHGSQEKFDIYLLCNKNNKESIELAKYYAKRRGIIQRKIIMLDVSNKEEITRDEYAKTIEKPLINYLGWKLKKDSFQNKSLLLINFFGMPLKIKHSKLENTVLKTEESKRMLLITNKKKFLDKALTFFNFKDNLKQNFIKSSLSIDNSLKKNASNAASVDSELSLLKFYYHFYDKAEDKNKVENDDFDTGISYYSGVLNPYYFSDYIKSGLQKKVIFVGRIDGASFKTAKRLIDDAIETERLGLYGFSFIDLANYYKWGEDVFKKCAFLTDLEGYPTVVDVFDDVFLSGYPIKEVAFYFGWYKWNIIGSLNDEEFKFSKGAVAAHLHSFSAFTIRDPKKNWVSGLIEKGAACSLGTVYEPYLRGVHNYDIFLSNLMTGKTLVESAFYSQMFLSWMNIVIGDPLYSPFDLSKRRKNYKRVKKTFYSQKLSSLHNYKNNHDLVLIDMLNDDNFNGYLSISKLKSKLQTKAGIEWDGFFSEGMGLKYLLQQEGNKNMYFKKAEESFDNAMELFESRGQEFTSDYFRVFTHKLRICYIKRDYDKCIYLLEDYLKSGYGKYDNLAKSYLKIFLDKKNNQKK